MCIQPTCLSASAHLMATCCMNVGYFAPYFYISLSNLSLFKYSQDQPICHVSTKLCY